MLDTQNCLQNHIKNVKTIKCLLQSAFYTGSTCKVLTFLHVRWSWDGWGAVAPPPPPVFAKFFAKSPFFAPNFGISMPTVPHVPVSPRTFKFTPPSMFYNFWFEFYVTPTRLSTSYAYLTLKALRGVFLTSSCFF